MNRTTDRSTLTTKSTESAENAGSVVRFTKANSKMVKLMDTAERSITTSTTKACTKEVRDAEADVSGTPEERTKVADVSY
mgnify:CR=1 FL=1